MRRHLTALLVAGLVLGACGGDDDGDQAAVTSIPDKTSTSVSSTTTVPRTVAPDVIPRDESQITEEYVEGVLNKILAASLEATRHTRQVGLVDELTIGIIESLNNQERSTQALNNLVDAALSDFAGFNDTLRPAKATVSELLATDTECVFAEVVLDNSGFLKDAHPLPENVRAFARLVPATNGQLSLGYNPTAWVIDALPATEDGSVPAETCVLR